MNLVKRVHNGPSRVGKLPGLVATGAFLAGGLLLVWSSYIHFHLWHSEGYRHIATLGPLFLLQSIAGLLLGVLVIARRRVWAAVLGVGFALSTMIGFLLSVQYGLFGFQDTWSAPFAHQAFFIELAAAATMTIAGVICMTGSAPTTASSTPAGLSSFGA